MKGSTGIENMQIIKKYRSYKLWRRHDWSLMSLKKKMTRTLNILCNSCLEGMKPLRDFISKKEMYKIAILPINYVSIIKTDQLFNKHYAMSFEWKKSFDIQKLIQNSENMSRTIKDFVRLFRITIEGKMKIWQNR